MNRALYHTLDRRTFMDRLVIQVYPSHFHSLSFSFLAKIEHNNAVWEHVNYYSVNKCPIISTNTLSKF
jgi:hypothetical protein